MTTWNVPARYTPGQVAYAVRHAKANPGDFYRTPGGDRLSAEQFLRWFRLGLCRRINRNRPRYGRKDGGDGYLSNFERDMHHLAYKLNSSRLLVREHEVPEKIRPRIRKYLYTPDDL